MNNRNNSKNQPSRPSNPQEKHPQGKENQRNAGSGRGSKAEFGQPDYESGRAQANPFRDDQR